VLEFVEVLEATVLDEVDLTVVKGKGN